MKKQFQSNLDGMTLGGGSIQHPLSIHSASIGTRWKPRVLQVLMTMVFLFTLGIGNVWAQTSWVRLDSIDFTNTTNFPAQTITGANSAVTTATIDGVFFRAKAKKSIKINNTTAGVDFDSQNGDASSHHFGIPVTGVNGSIKVIIYHDYNNTSANFKMGISHATDNDPSGTQTWDLSVGNSGATKNANDWVMTKSGLTGSEYIVWAMEAGSSYKVIKKIAIYTEAPTGYSVTYVENGHGATQTDLTGQTALPNPLPTLSESGWIFGGWFTNEGLTVAAVAGASISANTTLYAKWTEDTSVTKYEVTYNLGGASGTAPTQEDVAEGTVITLATAPSWSGHVFQGWLCDIDSEVKEAGAAYTMTAAPTTFTAQWKLENDATFGGTTCFTDAAVNLASLFTSSCGGTVTYSLKEASDHASVTGTSFTADAAGNYVVVATQASDATYAGVAKEATITVVPAPTHMVENRLVITNGASWGSSIYTTDGTNITNLSAFNPSRTGDGAINVNKKTANGSRSTNISSYTSENADNYMVLSFTVADGKRLRVSAVNIQPFSVSDTKHHRAWLANADGNKIVEATAELSKDACENVFANFDFSENAVYLTGTNYLKLWTWGSTNGYRLNTPIYIDGVISDIPATYSVTYVPNNGITPAETMTDSNSPYEAGAEVTLLSNTFTAPTGQLFDGWVATYNDGENDHELTITNGKFTMPAYNVTVTAQWADAISTYDITYVSAQGTAPAAANAASVVLAELSESGWQHVGWTANVDVTVDAETVTAGTLIANGKTAILASDVTFTAVWNQIYTVTYNANGGTCATSEATWKAGDDALVLPAATKDNFDFVGWYDAATGGNKIASPYTPSASIEVFAHYMPKLVQAIYSNTFDAFIKNQKVNVYYLEGESAPILTSIKVLGVETPVFEEADGNIKVTIESVDYIFPVTKTAVAPYTGTGEKETFDGTETYVKTGNSFSTDSGKEGWKFSKTDSDWSRETPGNTRIYFFLGAAESIAFENGGTARNIKVYRNGTLLDAPTSSGNAVIAGTNTPAMYAIVSNQSSGDGALKSMTTTAWKPVTAVTLKEGEDEISAKEIWASTSFTLTAEVTPDDASNKTITWTSSNNDVATVVNGVVTGVAANATPVTITASTVDGVNATCEVTVTTAPEPSADPVITAQPASANYYEGATIAALEVVATGESLSYQWYLGADAISGAESATYTPTVSAIGSYVYHCVVTNTEAGNLPTSLASDNATITIADDPAAIKLFDGEGNLNTTNFISPAKTTIEISDVEYPCLVQFSSNRTSLGGATPSDMVMYNVATDKAMIKMTFYNNNSGVKKAILYKYEEGAEAPEKIEIEVPGQTVYTTDYYTFNSSKNRSFYVCMNDRSNIRVLQVKVIDNGANPVKQFGQVGYSLNLNKGRLYAKDGAEKTFEGWTLTTSSEYKVYNNSNLATKAANSFTIASPAIMHVERSGGKYYVYQDPADKGTLYSANADIELNATGTWYLSSETTSSATSFTLISFAAPKCEKPTFEALQNSDICAGDPYVALDGTGTVTDGGTITYKWYAQGSETVLGTNATYTPAADGSYYVVALHHVDGFTDNEATSDVVTVTTYASAAITTAPEDQRVDAGENATLSVVASGKAPLTYQWYTCDENGDNAVIIAGAENASYVVAVTEGFSQYYKVVVTSGCGEASAVAKVEAWVELPQLDVTGSMTWDWTYAGENNKLVAGKNVEVVMANIKENGKQPTNDATFRSQALFFYGENVRATEGGRNYASVGHISFNTTVPGIVEVEFSDNGTNDRRLKINDYMSESSSSKTDVKTYKAYVQPGEVTLMGVKNDGTSANQYIRISKIIFTANPTPDYTRNVTNNIGTLCVDHNVLVGGALGATFYQIASRNEEYDFKIDFEEVLPNEELKAGEPYIFKSNTGRIDLFYGATEADAPVAVRGMIGSFVDAHVDIDEFNKSDILYIANNRLWNCEDMVGSYLDVVANRAYIVMSDVPEYSAPQQNSAPRRRVTLGKDATQTTTGVDNLNASEQPVKLLINGQIFILRGEKLFDVTGKLVK